MIERKIAQVLFMILIGLTTCGCVWNAVGGLVKVLGKLFGG